jgi:hypothetical protein
MWPRRVVTWTCSVSGDGVPMACRAPSAKAGRSAGVGSRSAGIVEYRVADDLVEVEVVVVAHGRLGDVGEAGGRQRPLVLPLRPEVGKQDLGRHDR